MIAHSHGRDVVLVDAPCFDRPVKLVWRKRNWRCEATVCPTKVGLLHERVAGQDVTYSCSRPHARSAPGDGSGLRTRA